MVVELTHPPRRARADASFSVSTDVEGKNVRIPRLRSALTALAAAGVLTAVLFASVTPAQATPTSRAQAVRAARNYLQVSAFSLKSLTEQLRYEGFSRADATYGASHSGANWMKQAVKAARGYLEISAFSFSSMVDQLRFEGFTRAQAVHGARAVGL